MYKVYVLQASNGKKYIGMTEDLNKRVRAHNTGESFWTKRYKNWKVVYQKACDTYSEARKWESRLKKQKGGSGLKKLIKETNESDNTAAHNPA